MLTALPRPVSWMLGPISEGGGEWKKGEGQGEEEGREEFATVCPLNSCHV